MPRPVEIYKRLRPASFILIICLAFFTVIDSSYCLSSSSPPPSSSTPSSSSSSVSLSAAPPKLLQNPTLHPLFAHATTQLSKPVRRVLIDNVHMISDDRASSAAALSTIDATNLLNVLPLSPTHKLAARYAMFYVQDAKDAFHMKESVLSPSQAMMLRTWARDELDKCEQQLDSVDNCPEWQVPVDKSTLVRLLGSQTVDALWELPQRWLHDAASHEQYNNNNHKKKHVNLDVGCFIRRYGPNTRPFIGFHVDDCDATINICLSSPEECTGGNLLLLAAGQVHCPSRNVGDATVHSWSVCHGVSAVLDGERWSFILFFSNRYPPDHLGFYKKMMELDDVRQNKSKKKKKRKNKAANGGRDESDSLTQ